MVKQNRGKDERTELSATGSSFFRIFFPELMRTQLKIPQEFVRDVLREVPNEMVLHCELGGPWPVKVIKIRNSVFLSDGWQRFVEDNLLQRYHFLHFTYDGVTQLVVQIFEKTGLKRDYSSASRTQEVPTSGRNMYRVQNQKSHSSAIKKEARCSTPKHPSFQKHIRSYNVARPFTFFLPKRFADEHFAEAKTVLRLNNAKGEAWQVNCSNYGKQYVFVGGWKRFAEDNKLKEGNICKFELVDKRTLQVQIF